jgi:ankyrin repeat protein
MNDNDLWNLSSLPKKKSLFKCFQRGTLQSSEDEKGVYTCECKDGWYGPTCNQERPKFSSIFRVPGSTLIEDTPFSDDYKNCEEEPDILKKLHLSLEKAKKCTYIAGPINPNGLVLGRFNIKWDDGEVMPINYLGMGERHNHDLNKIEKLGGSGETILPSVFIEAAIASARADNKCVDLFLEQYRFQPSGYRIWAGWMYDRQRLTRNNMLTVLRREVVPCLYGIRIPDDSKIKSIAKASMCKFGCKNVRIHETDVRSMSSHVILSKEKVFGLEIQKEWLRTLELVLKLEKSDRAVEEDILKFALYEDTNTMDERKYKVVLYRALAKHFAKRAVENKVLDNNKMSFYEWLSKPMLHADYLEDFGVTDPDFLEKNETPSYTNWDKIRQVARQVATGIIYHRNATKKLIRKRESALGEQKSAQLKKAIIKVHNFRHKFDQHDRLSLLSLGVMSMDYYTMLRMLSPYDTKKRAGPCPPEISGGNPRNIMMVAGEAHTLNYAYVFRELAGLPLDNVGFTVNNPPDALEKPFRITNTMIFDKKKISKVRNSIKTGLDLIHEWMKEETPLIIAVRQGHTERVRVLIEEAGFEDDLVEYEVNTAWIIAAQNLNTNMVQILIKAGADVNLYDYDGDTALIIAARQGRTEIVPLLLEAGADLNVNVTDSEGDTALIIAARQGHTEIVQLLIEAGADLDAYDYRRGDTALIIAIAEGHTEIAQLLIKAGADVNLPDYEEGEEGDTALTLAVRGGHTEIARLLLEAGADVNMYDYDGDTALIIAARQGHTEIAQLLRRRRRENDDSQSGRRTRRRFR